MPTLTESYHALEFLASEAPGNLSRAAVVVAAGQNLQAGHVIARITTGTTATVTADAGNTGNGVFTLDATTPVLGGASPGVYRVVCVQPVTNAGTFLVFAPSGRQLGRYNVGATSFANEIRFTIADGSADFVAGDAFSVTVAAGSGQVVEYNPAGSYGAQIPYGILAYPADATGGFVRSTAIIRLAEVKAAALQWFSGASAPQKSAALAQLATSQLIVAR